MNALGERIFDYFSVNYIIQNQFLKLSILEKLIYYILQKIITAIIQLQISMKYHSSKVELQSKNKDAKKIKSLRNSDITANAVLKNIDNRFSQQKNYADQNKKNLKSQAQSESSKKMHLASLSFKSKHFQSLFSKQNDKAIQKSQVAQSMVKDKKLIQSEIERLKWSKDWDKQHQQSLQQEDSENNSQKQNDIDSYQARSSKKTLKDYYFNQNLKINEVCESQLQEAELEQPQQESNQVNQEDFQQQQQLEDSEYQQNLDNQFQGDTSQQYANQTIDQQDESQTSRRFAQHKNEKAISQSNEKSISHSNIKNFKPRMSQELEMKMRKSEFLKNHLRDSSSNTRHTTIQSGLKEHNFNISKALDRKSNSELDAANSYSKNKSHKKISVSQLSKCNHFRQIFQQKQQAFQVKQIPQSYIIAMEQLQNKIKGMEQYVQQLHDQIICQEKQKLQAEEKINLILKKFQSLSESHQNLEVQNRQFRLEVQSLRKSIGLKQRLSMLTQHSFKKQSENQYLMQNDQPSKIQYSQSQQQQQAQSQIEAKQKHVKPSFGKSKQTQTQRNFLKKENTYDCQIKGDRSNQQRVNSKTRGQSQFAQKNTSNKSKNQTKNEKQYPTFNSEKDDFESIQQAKDEQFKNDQSSKASQQKCKSINSKVPSSGYFASGSKQVFQSAQISQSKFCSAQSVGYVSHYRQLIRYQKQLVALKYRQQCLERKLVANKRNSGMTQQTQALKKKLMKVTQQVRAAESKIITMKHHQNQGVSTTMHLRV